MSKNLTIAEQTAPTVHWSADQVAVLRNELFKGLTDSQLALFAQVCQRTGLDPFAKQVYAIVRGGKLTIQTSIDGYRLIAQRSGRYNGQTPPEWYDGAGWREVWTDAAPPQAARIGVYLKGADHPTYGVATWAEYADDRSPMWKKMSATMIAKCAEALALRKAFPAELSGLYTSEEMAQADRAPAAPPLTEEQVQTIGALATAAGQPAAAWMGKARTKTADAWDGMLAAAVASASDATGVDRGTVAVLAGTVPAAILADEIHAREERVDLTTAGVEVLDSLPPTTPAGGEVAS